jgi:hypothetical protein
MVPECAAPAHIFRAASRQGSRRGHGIVDPLILPYPRKRKSNRTFYIHVLVGVLKFSSPLKACGHLPTTFLVCLTVAVPIHTLTHSPYIPRLRPHICLTTTTTFSILTHCLLHISRCARHLIPLTDALLRPIILLLLVPNLVIRS